MSWSYKECSSLKAWKWIVSLYLQNTISPVLKSRSIPPVSCAQMLQSARRVEANKRSTSSSLNFSVLSLPRISLGSFKLIESMTVHSVLIKREVAIARIHCSIALNLLTRLENRTDECGHSFPANGRALIVNKP